MKPLRFILAAFLLMLGFTGCFQVEKIITLKPDGSGTIQETLVIPKAALAMMQQMGAAKGKPLDLFDEAKLKEAAAKMGDGVTYVSGKKVTNDVGEGFTATYAFTDINKLKVDQNPVDTIPGPAGAPAPKEEKKAPIAFHFTKGSPAELTFDMPAPEFKPKGEKAEAADEMAMQMMQQMFKDMKMTIALDVDGTIRDTNATYHNGSRITLMEMDFNKILADPAKFKALVKANPQSIQEARALLKDFDGVKIETIPQVKVKFQ